jgi:triosephosphate isomerase (TIM)
MKQLIIAGNWKSNKTITEAGVWMKAFAPHILSVKDTMKETIPLVCAPFLDLNVMFNLKKELSLPIEIGAQDVSPFPEGAYTGEVSARMLKETCSWVIIGHSERRKLLGEKEDELFNETKQAKAAGLKVIYCVSDELMAIPPEADVIGYEPTWAIGTGKTDTPENANKTVQKFKDKTGIRLAVYGGSITAENVAEFVKQPAIDGVLVGGASLDPEKFFKLIQNASSVNANG